MSKVWDGEKFADTPKRQRRKKKGPLTAEEVRAALNGTHRTAPPAAPADALPGLDELTTAAELPTRQLRWMLHPYLPFGNVIALTGAVNVGKSSFVASVVADATGGPPLDPEKAPREGCSVLYFVLEEDPSLLVRPRLLAAEADLTRVRFPGYNRDGRVTRKLCLPRDGALLEKWIRQTGSILVVFDPINSFLDEGLEGTRTEHVRPLMDALAAIASATECLIIAILHQRKSRDGSALDWVAGSAAWVQCARMVLALGRHPNDEAKRVLAVSKPGIIKDPPSRLYTLLDRGAAAQFRLGPVVDVDAAELTGSKADKVQSWKRDMAKTVLREELQSGEKPVKALLLRCQEMGISENTLHRAARELNIPTETRREGEKNMTYWKKPDGGFPA